LAGTTAKCQTHRGDEFPERPGCANKGMSFETDGKLCLTGELLGRATSDGFSALRLFTGHNDDCPKQACTNLSPQARLPLIVRNARAETGEEMVARNGFS
jgi:hypothetical protein